MQYDENAEKYGYEGEMTPLKCDELKDRWFWAYPTESVDCDGITGIAHEVYGKSEVDEVIAEKDKEIQRLENLCESYRIDCDNLAIREANACKEIERDNKQIRHQKYKRCLAMAYVEWLKQVIIGLHPESILYRKAYKRERKWKELAEKFKEAK